jgi:hypothetical protein
MTELILTDLKTLLTALMYEDTATQRQEEEEVV